MLSCGIWKNNPLKNRAKRYAGKKQKRKFYRKKFPAENLARLAKESRLC